MSKKVFRKCPPSKKRLALSLKGNNHRNNGNGGDQGNHRAIVTRRALITTVAIRAMVKLV